MRPQWAHAPPPRGSRGHYQRSTGNASRSSGRPRGTYLQEEVEGDEDGDDYGGYDEYDQESTTASEGMYPEEVYVGYDLEQDEDPEQDEQVECTIPEEYDETEEPPMHLCGCYLRSQRGFRTGMEGEVEGSASEEDERLSSATAKAFRSCVCTCWEQPDCGRTEETRSAWSGSLS